MKATEQELRAAMQQIEDSIGSARWLSSTGIGLVDGRPGIVISVAPGADDECNRIIGGLDLDVPIAIRVVGPIRKRPSD